MSSATPFDYAETVKAISEKVTKDLLDRLLVGDTNSVAPLDLKPDNGRVRRDEQYFMANGRWSSDEDATLRFLYKRLGKTQLAELLGRSVSSIGTRASMLKLKRRGR